MVDSDNGSEGSKDFKIEFILLPLACHKSEYDGSLGHGRQWKVHLLCKSIHNGNNNYCDKKISMI